MLKYYNYDIVFQEIPDEVTLAVNLTNCPHRCVGCHSPHLREDIGDVLNDRTLDSLLKKYGQQITCVCFMGGDGQAKDVETLAKHLRQHSKLKVAWYSGNAMLPQNAQLFDYVKVGGYKPELGGLRSRTTNQRLYRYTNGHSEDITERFWKK
ncbi:MAG: anaerobic ribonucleoside-triphosphate reductase activating protein [Bacteroidales bacterium]|nr:anaerobic ribonucleoside-triphosphate reductase activating protein [Bacteroidales bacterium]